MMVTSSERVTTPSLEVTIPSLSNPGQNCNGSPMPGVQHMVQLLHVVKGFHTGVPKPEVLKSETPTSLPTLSLKGFYSYSSTGLKHKCSGFKRISWFSYWHIYFFGEHCSWMECIKMNLQVNVLFNFLTNGSNSAFNSKGPGNENIDPFLNNY